MIIVEDKKKTKRKKKEPIISDPMKQVIRSAINSFREFSFRKFSYLRGHLSRVFVGGDMIPMISSNK